MLWQIVKKQGLTFMRNPQQLFLLIGLPIILISILSLALGGMMSGEPVNIDVKIAMLEYEDEQEQIDRFIYEVEQSELPKEAIQSIVAAAKQFNPVTTLTEEVFGEVDDLFQIDHVEPGDKASVLADESYTAVIEIPKSFTYDMLYHVFHNEDQRSTLQLFVNEEKQISSKIVEEILEEFEDQLSFMTYANKNGLDINSLIIDPSSISSSIRTYHTNSKPVSSQSYYTVAMAVMNVLFIASTIGSYAYREKQSNVFNRVVISDVSHWVYFFGIFISTVVFAFIQLMIIFGASWLIFNVAWNNVVGLLVISIGFSFAVGGVAVLLTAISYRLDSEVLINYFSSIIVTVFAFFGGSFFPVGDFSKLIRVIGELTPNGASMSAYLMILRGVPITSSLITNHLIYLAGFSFMLIVIAVISFPKRGQIQ